MPNFIEIGGVTRKPLVDLTRNDPIHNWCTAWRLFCDADKWQYTIEQYTTGVLRGGYFVMLISGSTR